MITWKSCKEELPSDFGDFLVRFSDGTYMVSSFDPIFQIFEFVAPTEEITHWTEIPEFDG